MASASCLACSGRQTDVREGSSYSQRLAGKLLGKMRLHNVLGMIQYRTTE